MLWNKDKFFIRMEENNCCKTIGHIIGTSRKVTAKIHMLWIELAMEEEEEDNITYTHVPL